MRPRAERSPCLPRVIVEHVEVTDPTRSTPSPREHGDRRAFLARARESLADGVTTNHVHEPPQPSGQAPRPEYLVVDADDLAGTFERIAADQGSVVHRCDGPAPTTELLAALVLEHALATAVCSAEPNATALAGSLQQLGVEILEPTLENVAAADLGITSAVAVVAATGSLVLDNAVADGRTVSLLPRVHLCTAPTDRIVATPADVWRTFTGHPELLPSNLVWVSGPSRTGDIEQLLTVGVHGPVTCIVILTESGAPQ